MLNLLVPTPVNWIEAVEQDIPGLLSDHAHCEIKAAQMALSLVGRFGKEFPALIAPLLELAREESAHASMVIRRMEGAQLGYPDTDEYVSRLRKKARQFEMTAPPLLDRLLVSSLVEARSCERFKLLSEKLSSESMRVFYRDLMESEARHYRLFTELAAAAFGESISRARFKRLAEIEGEIVRYLPLGPTVHG